MKPFLALGVSAAIAAFASIAAAAPAVVTPLTNLPEPAPSAFGLAGAALPDGRYLVWNGETVYLQDAVGVDAFTPVATGYLGDPGFAARSPDGTFILGAGFGGDLYRFDPDAPEDFTPAAVEANLSHYAGLFLTSRILLLDAGLPDFSGSKLVAIDLDAKTVSFKPAVVHTVTEKDFEIVKPPAGYSAALARNPNTGEIYAMDSGALELRAFDEQELLAAILAGAPLDWETDGRRIGQPGVFLSGGVAGVLGNGDLVLSGAFSFGGPGGIQIVSPVTGATLQFLRPFGNRFHNILYNDVLGTFVAISENGDSFAAVTPATPPASLPSVGGLGLAALGLAAAAGGLRVLRQR